jgi:hypothetical protein
MTCEFKEDCKQYDEKSASCNGSFFEIDRNSYCGIKRKFEKGS